MISRKTFKLYSRKHILKKNKKKSRKFRPKNLDYKVNRPKNQIEKRPQALNYVITAKAIK